MREVEQGLKDQIRILNFDIKFGRAASIKF
jgi:hypothetical protein